jgi:hypothetical protein
MTRIRNAVREIDKKGIQCRNAATTRTERWTGVVGARYGGASPVGLGLFFVLIAVAFDLVHFAFK